MLCDVNDRIRRLGRGVGGESASRRRASRCQDHRSRGCAKESRLKLRKEEGEGEKGGPDEVKEDRTNLCAIPPTIPTSRWADCHLGCGPAFPPGMGHGSSQALAGHCLCDYESTAASQPKRVPPRNVISCGHVSFLGQGAKVDHLILAAQEQPPMPPPSIDEIDVIRHREITSKAVSAIILLTLKWFKVSRRFVGLG